MSIGAFEEHSLDERQVLAPHYSVVRQLTKRRDKNMAKPLEDFLAKIRQDLKSLPPEEQERLLDRVSENLAQYIAVRLNQGMDEDVAVQDAIQQFEALHHSALNSSLSSPRRFGEAFSPTTVSALYFAVTSKIGAFIFAYLFCFLAKIFFPNLNTPSTFDFDDVLIPKGTPSLLFAIFAGAILLRRDGLSGVITTVLAPQTVIGTGVRWCALKQGFLTILSFMLLLIFQAKFQQSPALFLVGLMFVLLMPVAPFFAGWLVARSTPETGVNGVEIAAVTTGILTFADYCFFQFHSPGGPSYEYNVAFFVLLLLGQTLLAGLAITGARIGAQDAKSAH
jgi:hypothetical protein